MKLLITQRCGPTKNDNAIIEALTLTLGRALASMPHKPMVDIAATCPAYILVEDIGE